MQISQLVPGLVYFVMLKVAKQVLLILLDTEDNFRRAARKHFFEAEVGAILQCRPILCQPKKILQEFLKARTKK